MPRRFRPSRWRGLLMRPVDASSLVTFRILFGLIMCWEVLRYLPRIDDLYLQSLFHFTYPFFHVVRPWPDGGLYIHFVLMGAAALGIALGLWYRVFACLFTLLFSYVFLLDKAQYLNHFYLIILLAFLLSCVGADRSASVDGRYRPTHQTGWVPFWHLAILRAQIIIVYFYGGIAKLNGDWLRAEPMRHWLIERSRDPMVGPWLAQEWVAYVFSYGGLLLDLSVGFLLLWKRTRLLAFALLLLFHSMNAWLFSIGIFPYLAMAACVLFVEPETPRRVLSRLKARWLPGRVTASTGAHPVPSAAATMRHRGRFVLGFLAVYLGLQVLLPLRHWLYPGNVAWTEEGHRFSWRMKLRDKRGEIQFVARNPETGNVWDIDLDATLTRRQQRKMRTRPDMILQFAHFLRDRMQSTGIANPLITVKSQASLNNRPPQPFIDPTVNLAEVTYPPFTHATWILPLDPNVRPTDP